MTQLDIDFVRAQFPAFGEPSLNGFAHFENAGGSYACGPVIGLLDRYYRQTKLQPQYAFAPSKLAGEQMASAQKRMASWLNVDADEVNFGPSTTQNTYVIAQALRGILAPGNEIVVTNQDHEANIGSWRRLEAEGITVREWQVDPATGELNPDDLDTLLNENTRMVAFTQCSNIVGTIHPVRELADKIHAAGALVFVDGVAYSPHGLPDVDALGADLYVFSLYKVYGPHLGVMVVRKSLNERLPNQGHFFNSEITTKRFTPAGPDHAQIASVNGVIDYFETIHSHHFGDLNDSSNNARIHDLLRAHEIETVRPLLDFLDQHPDVRLIGSSDPEKRAPTLSFTVEGQSSMALAARLADEQIGVGVGNCYAYRLIQALGIDVDDGVVRTSLVHYTSPEEVSRLIQTLNKLI